MVVSYDVFTILIVIMMLTVVFKFNGRKCIPDFINGACYATMLIYFIISKQTAPNYMAFATATLLAIFCYDIKFIARESTSFLEIMDEGYIALVEDETSLVGNIVFMDGDIEKEYFVEEKVGLVSHVTPVDKLITPIAVTTIYGVNWRFFRRKKVISIRTKVFVDKYKYELAKEKVEGDSNER